MSIVFSIQLPIDQLPAPGDFVGDLIGNWCELYEDEPDVHALHTLATAVIPVCPMLDEYGHDKWLYDCSYEFYLSNVSTRGLEVWYRDNAFHVRVMTLACPEEWEFAFQILEFAASGENALVTTDDEPKSLRVFELREVFDSEVIFEILEFQLGSLFELVEREFNAASLSGPINEFHFGPWFCQRILSAFEDPDESKAEILDTIFSAMRIINFAAVNPVFEGIVRVDIEEIEMPGGEIHESALIEPEMLYFVPKVDSLLVSTTDGVRALIPSSEFKNYLSERFREPDELLWLDEYQFILKPITPARYNWLARSAILEFGPDDQRPKVQK